ncbi:hypothetical protein L1987_65199 [Smallanthus sonchifolius]|uniref:Uncharacterized protein n=1 Tax=Smallanthus sonchifolius TaxID=185202 RepID=A0ACB9BTS7_9ASTR|nr:hypothetical protein L1987_65199 [Smallanthus sonchifolius]
MAERTLNVSSNAPNSIAQRVIRPDSSGRCRICCKGKFDPTDVVNRGLHTRALDHKDCADSLSWNAFSASADHLKSDFVRKFFNVAMKGKDLSACFARNLFIATKRPFGVWTSLSDLGDAIHFIAAIFSGFTRMPSLKLYGKVAKESTFDSISGRGYEPFGQALFRIPAATSLRTSLTTASSHSGAILLLFCATGSTDLFVRKACSAISCGIPVISDGWKEKTSKFARNSSFKCCQMRADMVCPMVMVCSRKTRLTTHFFGSVRPSYLEAR